MEQTSFNKPDKTERSREKGKHTIDMSTVRDSNPAEVLISFNKAVISPSKTKNENVLGR